jgi:hypothetical protein
MTVGLWQFSFVGSLTLSAVGFSLYHLTSIWKHCEYEEEVPSIFRPSWYGSMTGSYIMELWIECKFSDCKYRRTPCWPGRCYHKCTWILQSVLNTI